MKKKTKIVLLTMVMLTTMNMSLMAQTLTNTQYRSIIIGNWGVSGTWERSIDAGASWAPATGTQVPTTNNSVIVWYSHTVTLETSGKSCVNLNINNGGKVMAGANAFTLRVGAGSSGTAGIQGLLRNDGTLGGVGDLMSIEVPLPASIVGIIGTGTANVGRIRFLTGNSNNPSSAVAGHTNDSQLIIDQDMNLYTAGNYCLSMPNSTVNPSDVMILTINAGKIVTVIDPTAKWENTLMASNSTVTGGNYTYNINGTLDLSATTATSAFIPYSNALSSINVNINGTVKLGVSFKADTVAGSVGGLSLKINNGGLLDATNTTSFIVGKTGTTANTTNGNIFWVVAGNGAIKRTIPGTGAIINFPIGTSIGSYTPVSISRDASVGASTTYKVGVQNTFDNTPEDVTKCVQRQWNISSAGGNIADTIRFSWTIAEQNANFNPAGTVNIMHWNGTGWNYIPATVTGIGTLANPYIAKAFGISSYSPFGITNSGGALPVSLLSFTASYNGTNVKLNWKTTNEFDVKKYLVQKSNDGRNFNTIGEVAANSANVSNEYNFVDASVISDKVYYRLVNVDVDATFTYSNIISLNTKLKNQLQVYPNPTHDFVTIVTEKSALQTTLQLSAIDGKVLKNIVIEPGTLQTSIYIGNIAAGKYILTAMDNNKKSITIIKQ